MGCGASVNKRAANSKNASHPAGQKLKAQETAIEAVPIMASLQGSLPHNENPDHERARIIHHINIDDDLCLVPTGDLIESTDIVQFETKSGKAIDIFEVYKDGDDFFPVVNGYELRNVKNNTPAAERRLLFPFALTDSDIDLYFCIIQSSERQAVTKARKCPRQSCETNVLKIHKPEIKISLGDATESQKVFLHKGETIEIDWSTTQSVGYRIEEKKYCPVSGGLYATQQPSEYISTRISSKGTFSKTFNDFGMTFLCRINDKNNIHDITACIVDESFAIKLIEITDDKILPNIIWLEQNDWIRFSWNGKHKQTFVQIESFAVSEKKQQSIELKTPGEHFFWPHEPSRVGCLYHQFSESGIFCFKNGEGHIGTIVVEPRKVIHTIPIFDKKSMHKIDTNALVRFEWQMTDSSSELVSIILDSHTSVVPDTVGGLAGAFDCVLHKCSKVEKIFQHHFHTCEAYILSIPQHGLFNFMYSDNKDTTLISIIVQNGVDHHRVTYNEDNVFEPNPLIINRLDQVWFESSTTTIASIYQTDEWGNINESEVALFQPQENSLNYYMKEFPIPGVYYFSTDVNSHKKNKNAEGQTQPLVVVVIPEIRFHYKSVGKDIFDNVPIIATINDFVIWQFDQTICHQSVQLRPDQKLPELISSNERAILGRKRQCLAVECTVAGTFFFTNPEFEKVTGWKEDRLVSTIIIDAPFSHNCFIATNYGFFPHVLYIAENETVSWTLAGNERKHQIFVRSEEHEETNITEDSFIDLSIAQYVPGVHHLHTFKKPGKYTIHSNRFENNAIVMVYSEDVIRHEKRQLQEPRIVEDIEPISDYGKRVHLFCPNRSADIYYTLSGSIPTRHFDDVHTYDSNVGIILKESGLQVIRAYAYEDQKISSAVMTSSPTFVMENKEIELMNERRRAWSSSKINLSVSLEHPNKIYGTLTIEPRATIDFIKHYELYVNGVAHDVNVRSTDLQFSVEGFSGGEQYEIYVRAYSTNDIQDTEPISSNRLSFEIPRINKDGGPLITLAISKDPKTFLLTWAHLGDHVTEYTIFVDDVETSTIRQRDFSEFYGVHFQGAHTEKKYSFRVQAKVKDSTEILKSNNIIVESPLKVAVKGKVRDEHFPYLIINGEPTPYSGPKEVGSNRLPSSKLSKRSSSSPPSSPRPPAASSRPSVHSIDLNDPSLVSGKMIHHEHHETANDKVDSPRKQEQPQYSVLCDASIDHVEIDQSTEHPVSEGQYMKQESQELTLSEDSKRRARDLLRLLTDQIETRSRTLSLNPTFTEIEPPTSQPPTSQPPTSQPPTVQPPATPRTIQNITSASVIRHAIPKITYKHNLAGIVLLWKSKYATVDDYIQNYRIMVDEQQYGRLIKTDEETKFQINLTPGTHKCYVEIIPKEEVGESFKSNILKIDVPTTDGLSHERMQQNPPSDAPIHNLLEQEDIPVPQLNVHTTSATSVRISWYLDRPMPINTYVALCEVHICGEHFPDTMTSDEKIEHGDNIEHIWYVVGNTPLHIEGIAEHHEYTIFLRSLFHMQGCTDLTYLSTFSNKVVTTNLDRLGDMLPRPILQVTDIGLQTVTVSWKLSASIEESLIKGYRIIQNSKPTEIISPTQNKYDLRNLKPGTTNEIRVSITCHSDFHDEKVSEPIRIVCAERPKAPIIEAVRASKPFSIRIKWSVNSDEQDDITSFKIFLDGKVHDEILVNGRQSFIYEIMKLKAERTYSIYVKACIEGKRLDGYMYQCQMESKPSNELVLKCAAPPQGTMPRIERMDPNGVFIVWDPSFETQEVKITGYQVLKDGRAIGKQLPVDKREMLIGDLDLGNRYSIQILPITDQPGGTLIRLGEAYDVERHGHYIPGPKLVIEYTDLIEVPNDLWKEKITGHSAMICWSPIDTPIQQERPDKFLLSVWNDNDSTADKPMIFNLTSDKLNVILKDLQPNTEYKVQLETFKKRHHQTTNDLYVVSNKSKVLSFETGKPPDPPSYFRLAACTNTHARCEFTPFTEHNAEIKALRVNYKSISSEEDTRENLLELRPNETEFILSNLMEHTQYEVTIHAITEEYLKEHNCRDTSQLPLKLESSYWSSSKSMRFETNGCEPIKKINIIQATTESIQLEWVLPKAYGSTTYIKQVIRWKLEHGGEDQNVELDRNTTKYTIPGRLPSGPYKISIDAYFSTTINLDVDDETSRKEFYLTTTVSAFVRFHVPVTCEQPELYLTGYTLDTIDLAWNKPNMFSIVDHPEKLNEQLKIHRKLIEYRIQIDGETKSNIDGDQYNCTLTKCEPGREYKVELCARSVVQTENLNNNTTNIPYDLEEPDEISSNSLRIRMLKKQDYLRSFQAKYEFNPCELNESIGQRKEEIQSLGKINVKWTVSDASNISHFMLEWRSTKDLILQRKIIGSDQNSASIESCDEKYVYSIKITIVTKDQRRLQYEELTIPIPGEPDAPELWLVKTSDTSFVVEWSEPKSYGISVIGFQLYIEGKKKGDIIQYDSRRAEISSRINRTYQVSICAITSNALRSRSVMSATLVVITTPTTSLIPTIYYDNNDGIGTSFDRTVARIIPLQIEPINEEKLHLDWTSFLSTDEIRAYYVQYTCLNNGEVKTMKVSKKFRHCVLRALRPGFTYGIMVMAVDRNGGVLYTSDKSTIQMNAPPNAPIVAIRERTTNHVKLEWRPAASYGNTDVVGYKIFVNDRLAAILGHDQLTYTLTNGQSCALYTVHVQALSNDKEISSPMSRAVKFAWPGIRPGAFRRKDNGQTGAITVTWEHPQLEDETEDLIGYELYSENVVTHAQRSHGKYDAAAYEATIFDLPTGKYIIWLEIYGKTHQARTRPITVVSGRLNLLRNRPSSSDPARCFMKKPRRIRSSGLLVPKLPLLHTQYS